MSWGLQQGSKAAFRPHMELSSGELSGLGGHLMLMTATATKKTIRILQSQFPEVLKWKMILNHPMRTNISLIVPSTDVVSKKLEDTLAPFITRMKIYNESYLVLVRGRLNKVCALIVFFFLKV